MPSFDIVSEVDLPEVRNAIENAQRELTTRFDFRGADATIAWDDKEATLKADSDFQLQQMRDILRTKLVKRGVDVETMTADEPVHSGKTFSQKVRFKEGVDADMARKLVKMIKESKAKVQVAIQGEQVRVTGKKRDDLQEVMALVRAADLGQPFQFTNFRD